MNSHLEATTFVIHLDYDLVYIHNVISLYQPWDLFVSIICHSNNLKYPGANY